MSQLYKRMLLIRPDVFEKIEKGTSSSHPNRHEAEGEVMSEDDGPQAAFMRREMIKDNLSPIAPTVNVLEHLQKEMTRVLKDPTMATEEKLATYNNLMTRSQILTSKAKSMTTEPYNNYQTSNHSFGAPPTHDEVSDLSGDETQPDKRPIPVREKNKTKKSSGSIPEPLLKEIEKVLLSYRETVKKLYSTLNTGKGSQSTPHFTKSGGMVLEGNVKLDEFSLARLLTTVVRPTGKKRPDLPHQQAFLRVLKKLNPKMHYIRYKTLEYDISPTRVPQQAGDGFRKKRKPFVLKWSTRL